MRAAARGLPITKLPLYDPPFQIHGTSPDYWTDLARQIDDLVSTGTAATPSRSSKRKQSAYRPRSSPNYGKPRSGRRSKRSPTPSPTNR